MNLDGLKERIKGPVFPIVTPFKDGSIDSEALGNYIDYLYTGGARIFHVMVHTSRFSLLTLKEQLELNYNTTLFIKDRYEDTIVIAAGPLNATTKINIDFARSASAAGADLIGIIFSERYYNDDQVYNYFSDIARQVPNIGILIHEEQMNTIHGAKKINWPIDLLDRVADINNVIAIKEDCKEDEYTDKVVATLKGKLAIIVSGGSKEQFMKFAPKGCQAYLVGIASVFPTIATKFHEAYEEGDLVECQNIIEYVERPYFKVVKKLGWHVGLKSSLHFIGIMANEERDPLPTLTGDEYNEVANIVKKLQTISW